MTNRLVEIEKRRDISPFFIHLTRDSRKTFPSHGGTAEENFLSILDDKKIRAYRPHGLYGKKIPLEHRARFKATCFTETPLEEIKYLIEPMPGRSYELDSYGFVF